MRLRLVIPLVLGAMIAVDAHAYPQFQVWVEKNSGRSIDCAMCHTNPDGPEGVKDGQIRSLNREELDRLNDARAAFLPGMAVDSPILNDFGDRIIQRLGKKKFLEIRVTDPGQLATAYGFDSDLDGDGIPDAQEYLDGTLPVDPRHGDPWRLFKTNLERDWFDLLMVTLATMFGLWGLNQLLRWFEHASQTVEGQYAEGGKALPLSGPRRATRLPSTPRSRSR